MNTAPQASEPSRSDSLAPIPSPLSEQWRRFRFHFLHLVAFVVVCGGVAFAWHQLAQPLTFPGQAETIQASVTAPESGLLTNLWVTSFQQVKAGEPIAEISSGNAAARCKPLSLVAPITGVVTAIHHQPGEQILAGQPVVTITSEESQRILAFIPTSFPVLPEIGTKVEVRTRSRNRRRGVAKVIGVGPQWQSITNVLAYSLSGRPMPTQLIGRPVAISLPPGLRLVPGEPVEITVKR